MVLHLSELICRAIEQSLEDKIAVAFSGGLDSTIIATIAKKHADVELFCVGMEGSEDMRFAQSAAEELKLPLHKIIINEKLAMEAYGKCHALLPLDLLKLEILVPVYCAAQAASEKKHHAMLFGSAAEELFAGYDRYYIYKEEGRDVDSILKEEYKTLPQRDMGWVKKICRHFSIDARFPFYNNELAQAMFSVPIEERMDDRALKKTVLREAGKMLGVPDIVLKRKKKAMQYGSGVHKLFMKNAEMLNKAYPAL